MSLGREGPSQKEMGSQQVQRLGGDRQQGGWAGMWLRMSRRAGAEVLPQPLGQATRSPRHLSFTSLLRLRHQKPPSPAGLTWGCGGTGSSSSRRERWPRFLWFFVHYLCLRLFSRNLDPAPPFLPALGSTLLAVGEERGEAGIQRVGPSLKLNPHFCARPCSPPGSGAPRTCPWAVAGLRPLV